MGMAASQARLLSITARMSNNEFEQQSVAYSKQRLSENSGRINDEYLEALNKTKYQVLTGYNGTDACYADITYNQLTGCNTVASGKQYLVKDNSGKVLVSSAIANAFKAGNGDLNIFLKQLGYTQADIDTTKSATAEESIHEAWDKYLNSVGKSIYDVNGNTSDSADYQGEHILGFDYRSFGAGQLNGIPTYSRAYVVSQEGKSSFYAYKDDEGYYVNRSAVVARNYVDENNETKTGVFYQTEDQLGSSNYTQLVDVTYDATTKMFTYLNDKNERVQTSTLYATQRKDGSADLSETQKDRFSYNSKTGLYTSDSGYTYSITKEDIPLNYDGTTQTQRDLYDYATAITEAYYNKSNKSKDDTDLTYDAQQISYYKNIFYQMQSCGFTTLEEKYGYDEKKAKKTLNYDSTWMINQLKSGNLVLSYYSTAEKGFIGTTLDDDESITEKEDKSAIAKAEQEYTTAMDKIESQDKQFDMQLNKLESEHTAMQTEYDQLAKVISKNVEKSFNIFNA